VDHETGEAKRQRERETDLFGDVLMFQDERIGKDLS
jgi:hypothetical protein